MHPILRGIRAGYIMPDGSPRHAEADGWYWLAGALGGAGERDHGGNGSPPASRAQCLERFASMMRVSKAEARRVRDTAYLAGRGASIEAGFKHGCSDPAMRAWFVGWLATQRQRWAQEVRDEAAELRR